MHTARQRHASLLLSILGYVYATLLVACAFVGFSPYQQFATVPELYRDVHRKLAVTNDFERDAQCISLSASARQLDYSLPVDARVFVGDIVGTNNSPKIASYFFLNYYLLPRTVAVSHEEPAQFLFDFVGRLPESTNDLIRAGYDVLLTHAADGRVVTQSLKPMVIQERDTRRLLARYPRDAILACLLPLLAASLGALLLRCVLPILYGQFAWSERLVYAFALGSLIIGQAFLGARLLGWGVGPAWFWGPAMLSLALLTRRYLRCRMRSETWRVLFHPVSLAWLPALALFIPIFLLASLDGLREFDAVMAWDLKAKLLYYFHGRELLARFPDPALAYAHLDYPLLVPSLTA